MDSLRDLRGSKAVHLVLQLVLYGSDTNEGQLLFHGVADLLNQRLTRAGYISLGLLIGARKSGPLFFAENPRAQNETAQPFT